MARAWLAVLAMAAAMVLGGCSQAYVTPGPAADFRALGITADEQLVNTDVEIRQALDRRPVASFPAAIAVIHVQGPRYSSYSYNGYGGGGTSVVTLRDAEMDVDFQRLTALPMVRGVAPVNRLVVPANVQTEKDLRVAAANVQADMTLLYTFDTRFGHDTIVPVAGVITLGMFPSREARVTSTCSAALVDTRSGYVYGLAETTEKTEQLTNAWTTKDAVEQSRRRAERRAFAGMVSQMETVWKGVVEQYAAGASPTAAR